MNRYVSSTIMANVKVKLVGRRHVEDHVAHAAVGAAVDEVTEETEVEAEVDPYNDQRLDSLFQLGPNPN